MFSSIKIAVIFMIAGTVVAGAVYVKKLQEDLETARANVAKMEVAVQTSEASLKLMQEETVRLNALNQQLGDDLRKAEEYGDELRNTLQKHNLTHLANKKPGLIQNRMQNATDKLWDDLADITDPNRVQQSVESTGTTNPSSN
jgi:multidrug resistance efflux pump